MSQSDDDTDGRKNRTWSRSSRPRKPEVPKLGQETLTIVGAAIALAALILTSTAGVRGEVRMLRDEMRVDIRDVRTEIREVRAEARADREALRAEARADREALRAEARADRKMFQKHILRLTEEQSILGARLDGMTDEQAAR